MQGVHPLGMDKNSMPLSVLNGDIDTATTIMLQSTMWSFLRYHNAGVQRFFSWECAALIFSERALSYCCRIRVDNDGWINKETALSSFDGPLFDDFCHTKLLVAPCLCRLASSWMMVLPPFLFWTLAGGPFDSFSWVLLRHSMENQDSGYHFGSFVFSFFLRSCRLFFVWSFLDSG